MEGSITDLSKYHYESVLDDLDTAFRLREKADYQDFVIISKEQTQEQAEKAEIMLLLEQEVLLQKMRMLFSASGWKSKVGAGSIVTKDVPDNVIAYGNPCRVVRENK